MGVHANLTSMSQEAIEEYLAIAHHCITTPKPDGGVYGYPAVLLLFSVVDALSNYAGYRQHSFRALKDIFPSLREQQITKIANWYRHLLSHQAIIAPGTQMTVGTQGPAIELNASDEPTHIRVEHLYDAVKAAWAKVDVTKIKHTIHPKQVPKSPIIVIAPAASGANVKTAGQK